jgi:hypothetical protein
MREFGYRHTSVNGLQTFAAKLDIFPHYFAGSEVFDNYAAARKFQKISHVAFVQGAYTLVEAHKLREAHQARNHDHRGPGKRMRNTEHPLEARVRRLEEQVAQLLKGSE